MKHGAKVRVSAVEVNLEPAHSHERSTWLSALGLLLGKQQSSVPESFLYRTFGSWKHRELQDNRGGKDLWSGSDEAAQGHVWLRFEVPGRDILRPLWASTPTSEHPHKEWTFPGISSSGCWHRPPFYASRTVEMFLTVPKEAAGKTSSLLPLSALQLRGKQTGVRSRPDIRKKF